MGDTHTHNKLSNRVMQTFVTPLQGSSFFFSKQNRENPHKSCLFHDFCLVSNTLGGKKQLSFFLPLCAATVWFSSALASLLISNKQGQQSRQQLVNAAY